MCRTSGAALGLAKGTFPAQGFSFPQPPDDTKRPLRRRKRGMLKEATILDKIDGKFIPHLSSKMVRLRWLDIVFQGQYLPSLSVNCVAINKDLEKLTPQLY